MSTCLETPFVAGAANRLGLAPLGSLVVLRLPVVFSAQEEGWRSGEQDTGCHPGQEQRLPGGVQRTALTNMYNVEARSSWCKTP
eukprot:1157512-Pelagomonas_calceolata.AAC.13